MRIYFQNYTLRPVPPGASSTAAAARVRIESGDLRLMDALRCASRGGSLLP
jgi:hypothetical protein